MGACTFMTTGRGKTAAEAFSTACEDDRHQNGASYSGGIGMKRSFTMITAPAGIKPSEYANKLLDDDDRRVKDKWGPAGCIKLAEGEYLFFGWASE